MGNGAALIASKQAMKPTVTLTSGFVLFTVLSLTAGCGQDSKGVGLVAPEKPLSQAQKQLLDQVNALPQSQRRDFVMKHGQEIMKFSTQNKTFGDGMNAALGVTPPKS